MSVLRVLLCLYFVRNYSLNAQAGNRKITTTIFPAAIVASAQECDARAA